MFRGGLRGRVGAGGVLGSFADRLISVWGTCGCRPVGQLEGLSCWRWRRLRVENFDSVRRTASLSPEAFADSGT